MTLNNAKTSKIQHNGGCTIDVLNTCQEPEMRLLDESQTTDSELDCDGIRR